MDTYHAPFTPKHRYWVGLLLCALIIHNLVVAMTSNTAFSILSSGVLSVGLIVWKQLNNRLLKVNSVIPLKLSIYIQCCYSIKWRLHCQRYIHVIVYKERSVSTSQYVDDYIIIHSIYDNTLLPFSPIRTQKE